jgi:2-dehydro-3-deoxyphosphogluconate aldolase / (4S)-4-hydroxy-2-oxoglutarate aldolase
VPIPPAAASRYRDDMNKAEKIDLIRKTGVVAILRAQRSERLIEAAEAIRKGGVSVIEVSLTTPGALEVIAEATQRFGQEVLWGAGTVLDADLARRAIQAGAGFIVAPTLNLEVIKVCHDHDVPVMPGCLTPTEMWAAWRAGADFIKLFPADVGGPQLIKAILAPLPQLSIVPVGGVDLQNATAFIQHGAVALGLGSSLVNQALLDAGDLAELKRRATAFIQAVEQGRNSDPASAKQ